MFYFYFVQFHQPVYTYFLDDSLSINSRQLSLNDKQLYTINGMAKHRIKHDPNWANVIDMNRKLINEVIKLIENEVVIEKVCKIYF